MATENYFDGEWRPVTDHSFKALERLRTRGFELGNDRYGKLMARWPIAPAAPLNEMARQVARYQAHRAAATMPDGARSYGWWKRYQTHLSIAEMAHADIVKDAARTAKQMDSETDD